MNSWGEAVENDSIDCVKIWQNSSMHTDNNVVSITRDVVFHSTIDGAFYDDGGITCTAVKWHFSTSIYGCLSWLSSYQGMSYPCYCCEENIEDISTYETRYGDNYADMIPEGNICPFNTLIDVDPFLVNNGLSTVLMSTFAGISLCCLCFCSCYYIDSEIKDDTASGTRRNNSAERVVDNHPDLTRFQESRRNNDILFHPVPLNVDPRTGRRESVEAPFHPNDGPTLFQYTGRREESDQVGDSSFLQRLDEAGRSFAQQLDERGNAVLRGDQAQTEASSAGVDTAIEATESESPVVASTWVAQYREDQIPTKLDYKVLVSEESIAFQLSTLPMYCRDEDDDSIRADSPRKGSFAAIQASFHSFRNLVGRKPNVEDPYSEIDLNCCICLSDYKAGDVVCWSKARDCNHVFCELCITHWLRDHDECPYCRKDIFNLEPSS